MVGSGTVCFSGETAYITDGRCLSITQTVRTSR